MPLLLFILYPLLEIACFVWIGGMIGVWWTLAWVIAGFFIGAWMLMLGGQASREWLRNARQGSVANTIGKQLYWYIGGLLIILPGFLTDFIGVMLVFPPTQWLVTNVLSLFIPESLISGFTIVTNMGERRRDDGNTLDGHAEEIVDNELLNPDNRQ